MICGRWPNSHPVFESLEVHHREGANLRIGGDAGDLGGRDDAARGDVDLALDVGVGLGGADLPEDRADHEQRPTPVADRIVSSANLILEDNTTT